MPASRGPRLVVAARGRACSRRLLLLLVLGRCSSLGRRGCLGWRTRGSGRGRGRSRRLRKGFRRFSARNQTLLGRRTRAVQSLIEQGVAEGAKLVAGGPGRPQGIERGFFARPTIFSRVSSGMTIAREEIFGPVLSILPYKDEDDAVRIANDTPYGLSGYVSSADLGRARAVARRLRTGNVHLNGAPVDMTAPFGGYKQSGLGREWGAYGLEEFLETKAIIGYGADD